MVQSVQGNKATRSKIVKLIKRDIVMRVLKKINQKKNLSKTFQQDVIQPMKWCNAFRNFKCRYKFYDRTRDDWWNKSSWFEAWQELQDVFQVLQSRMKPLANFLGKNEQLGPKAIPLTKMLFIKHDSVINDTSPNLLKKRELSATKKQSLDRWFEAPTTMWSLLQRCSRILASVMTLKKSWLQPSSTSQR